MAEEESVPESIRVGEAAELKALWDIRATMSQAAFAEAHDLGNQSNVGHYLHGRQPLNIKAAQAFAEHLGCRVEAFSPRVAADIIRRDTLREWPFQRISPDVWTSLSRGKREVLEGMIMGQIMDWEDSKSKSHRG